MRAISGVAFLAVTLAPVLSTAQEVEFNRDIRPIFSDKCYTCHGPDKGNRKSKIHFDTEAGAKQDLGGRFVIVPGDPTKSELVRRITAEKPAMRMPPVWSGYKLTDHEIGLISHWIEQGAKWEKHWAFIPPKRRPLPDVKDANWPRNAIDNFVLARLEREGLDHATEADRERLIRRVTLDLTGLPPTPAEIDEFLNDKSPGAYEKVVDRLLDSARYADTNGYQTDAERSMWRWRDWVIDAFNHNVPFDRFTVEQIAGDMLPNATLDQKIATGFNRNHRGNGEGGIIPEEYAVEYVVDRVDTTATVFLGLTVGCARCHNHKFDPFTQAEYYRMFAYFNRVPERGNAFKYGNSPPVVAAPTPEQESALKALEGKLAEAEQRASALEPRIGAAQRAWEASLTGGADIDWATSRALAVHLSLNGNLGGEVTRDPPRAEKYLYLMENGPVQQGVAFTGQAQWKGGTAQYAAGPSAQAADFDGARYIDAGNVGNFGFYDFFTLAA